ncbi:hypothetical protein QN277_006222 [Acacia crassicarpa]|uniref:Chromo domain-containing protein n=1 Tax=Acacia crassicarpa TaxID=499986 RepID=A0AAE1MH37_9FABA|nr:hypothetical protein QN277_006222 [Acacia crassicarpa]
MVMVKLLPQQFKVFRKVHKGLICKYEGPYKIVGKVGKVSYKLDLPPNLKIHPVFQISMLKPFHEDVDDLDRAISTRAPSTMTKSFNREVEEVLADRVVRRRGLPLSTQCLIKCKGLPESEATWEPQEDLWQFEEHLH